MSLINTDDEAFKELYKNNDIVVLDFWAAWCGPCHNFAPVFKKVSEAFPEIPFAKVDTEENPKLSQYFGIRSIPTVIVIREELEVFRGSGMSEADLTKLINEVKSADMEEVKKKIDSE
jgi:thioredoxin 1